jgi:DNA helicase-2/ATP-dependent DNA helicase PcrA
MFNKQPLSPEQTQAAFCFDAPICILAGAGSGKTRVITHRIAHLVNDLKVPPWQILGVTFTNKAARELRERVELLLPQAQGQVLLGTFHGLSAKFLRMHGEVIDVNNNFLIYDEDDSVRLIKQILKEKFDLTKEELQTKTKQVLNLKHRGKSTDPSAAKSPDFCSEVLRIYYERLKKVGAVDFDLLLEKFLELLQSDEGLMRVCSRVKHIVVDEYQDINATQSQIVKLIAEHCDTAAIVGDDDQSIYGWRGASSTFMQEFLTYFSHTKLFKLEDNYRSTAPILEAANHVISHNEERLGKNLKAINGAGELLRVSRYFRDTHEALTVVENALRCFEKFGTDFSVAVLMRTNAQSRPLEDALHRAKMPYRMVGGMRFYDRKEIKDILAAARAILHEHSDVDLMRLLDALPLGIGPKTITQMATFAASRGWSLFETMSQIESLAEHLGIARGKKKILELVSLLKHVRSEIISKDAQGQRQILRADEAMVLIIGAFGFAKYYDQKMDEESVARLENIEQLVQAAVSFVQDCEDKDESGDLHNFLETVSLISKDESVNESGDRKVGVVTLMTLHAAKGLEFDAVFLVGLEEGVLPHSRATQGFDEQKRITALEEERRLMYVGMTRARKLLYLSFCQERFLHGRTSTSLPSRFLTEIPDSAVDPKDRWVLKHFGARSLSPETERPNYQDFAPQKLSQTAVNSKHANTFEDDASDDLNQSFIKKGSRVYHAVYRYGSVVSLSGAGKLRRAHVKFDGDEIRVILVSHLDGIEKY